MGHLLQPVLALAEVWAARGKAAAVRIAMIGIFVAAAGIAAVAAVACMVAALWMSALARFGPVAASLVSAGALGLISVVLIVLAVFAAQTRRTQTSLRRPAELSFIDAARLLQDRPGTMVLAAVIAGLAAGSARRDR